jgi:hypothetical protein
LFDQGTPGSEIAVVFKRLGSETMRLNKSSGNWPGVGRWMRKRQQLALAPFAGLPAIGLSGFCV